MTDKYFNMKIKNIENRQKIITIQDEEEPKIQKQIKQNPPEINNEVTPWLSIKTAAIKHPTVRFHNEIIEFFQYIFPSETEHQNRLRAQDRVERYLKQCAPNVEIQAFGSFRTRLYLPNADIDLVMMDKTMSSKSLYKIVAQKMMEEQSLFQNVNLIANAKVPIIKFIEAESQYNFDLSFNQLDGLKQIEEIQKAFSVYPEMKYMIMILKCMLRQRDLNETYSGGIGSFLLFQMILAFLREFRKEAFANHKQEQLKQTTLGEYLLKFLEFYGSKFDLQRKRIVMVNGGGIVNKPNPDDKFSLISPQDPDHDVGSSSYKIREIFKIFQNRYNFMANYSFKPGESILKFLINPSDQKFSYLKIA